MKAEKGAVKANRMIIICPKCDSRYLMQADAIKKGRKVRCAKCQHVWFQTPENAIPKEEMPEVDAAMAASQDGSTPIPEAVRPDFSKVLDKAQKDGKAQTKGRFKAVAALVLLFALFTAGLFYGRGAVTAVIPGMEKFYTVIGLEPMSTAYHELVFDRVEAIAASNGKAYRISGQVLNLSSSSMNLPFIEASALDAHGVIIGDKQYYAFEDKVIQGENTRFFDIDLAVSEKPSDFELRFVTHASGDVQVLDEDVLEAGAEEMEDLTVEDHVEPAEEEHEETDGEEHGGQH